MLPYLLLVFCAQEAPPAIPDPHAVGRGNPALDVLHYELRLRLDPRRRFIEGTATLEFDLLKDVNSLDLDFHHMLEVKETRLGGKVVPHSQESHRLTLKNKTLAAKSQKISVDYRGLLPQEASQGDAVGLISDGTNLVAYLQPDGAHHWFPCNDHPSDKALFDMYIEVPNGLVVGALGTLISETKGPTPDHTLFHWQTKIPTATYLAALGAGPYKIIQRECLIPLADYVEKRDVKAVTKSLAVVAEMVGPFMDAFGPYPFEKYGHVLTRNYVGGMEDQTLTVLGRSEALSGDHALLSHELGHQWFGNWVTPRQWKDLWLNEGWATWCELFWKEIHGGKSTRAVVKPWRKSTIRLAIQEHPWTLANPDPDNLFSTHLVYNKGGMVIAMLDQWLGREKLLQCVRSFFKEFGGGNASNDDFQKSFSKTSGQDLEPFFDAWVKKNTVPIVSQSSELTGGPDSWQVKVTLKQENGWHPMAGEIAFRAANGIQKRFPLRFESAEVLVEVELGFPPEKILFDPDRILPWIPSS